MRIYPNGRDEACESSNLFIFRNYRGPQNLINGELRRPQNLINRISRSGAVVAHQAHNLGVVGSNPTSATKGEMAEWLKAAVR